MSDRTRTRSYLFAALVLSLACVVPAAAQQADGEAERERVVRAAIQGAPPVADPWTHGQAEHPDVPTPQSVIGWEPGADYKLADYGQITAYFEALAAASPRVQLETIGTTAEGRPMMLAVLSSEENLARRERLRAISASLAAGEGDSASAAAMADEGVTVVWVDGGLHATEVSGAQFPPKLAYRVATEETEEMRKIRSRTVMLLMPVMNPDGLEIVANWYRSTLGTEFEGARLPELYQKYVGHDNNRDWFMIQQPETRAIANQLWHVWFPQIVLNHHQTAPFPARIFIPPFADPVNPHIPPLVVTGINVIGTSMHRRFAQQDMPGAVSRVGFTQWWNGGMRTAPYFHNQVGLLTEVGHNSATPGEYDPGSLPSRFSNGWSTERASTWYPDPWKGGWWRLANSVDYMVTSSMATLDVAADLKDEWLMNTWRMARSAIEAGEQGGPFAYVVDLDAQRDASEAVELLEVLRRGGVEVQRASTAFQAGGARYPSGSFVIPAAQAYRAFAMDLLEPQSYPDRRLYPGGPPNPPYDISGWTLPMQMGVDVVRVDDPFEFSGERLAGIEIEPQRGGLEGDRGGRFMVSGGDNAAFRVVNRFLSGELRGTVRRTTSARTEGGREFPAGSFVIEADADLVGTAVRAEGLTAVGVAGEVAAESGLTRPRVGLYKSWVASMDEGWTRWVLEQYGFAYRTLTDADVRAGLDDLDVVILPSQSPRSIQHGHTAGRMPPEYVGGIGLEGVLALQRFVEGGGALVALDDATELAIQQFGLPVRNVTEGVPQDEFFIPGSLIRVEVDNAHPLGWGMADEAAVFFSRSRAFSVAGGVDGNGGATVVARYATEDLLMSGWEIGAERYLAGRPAVVDVALGEGHVVLVGFRPQFRAQPRATFKLLFNAILNAGQR